MQVRQQVRTTALERSLDQARAELAAQQLQASRQAQSHRELLVAFDKYKAHARPAVTCIDPTQGGGARFRNNF